MTYCNLKSNEAAAAESVFQTVENIQRTFNSHFGSPAFIEELERKKYTNKKNF